MHRTRSGPAAGIHVNAAAYLTRGDRMDMTGKEIASGIADVIATHQILRYSRGGKEEHARMVAGATLAGIGFLVGPRIEQHITHLPRAVDGAQLRRQTVMMAGGALLGGVLGYVVGPDLYRMRADRLLHLHTPLHETITHALDAADPSVARTTGPGGLLAIASAGWLGYSLFLRDHTAQWRARQRWGLGCGALGYLYGPETLRRVQGVPAIQGEGAIQLYARGSAALGAVLGAASGWYLGGRRHDEHR